MQADAVSDESQAVVTEIPSGMPHPDGVQRIKNVSRRLSSARDQMLKARDCLDEFQSRSAAPGDENRRKNEEGVFLNRRGAKTPIEPCDEPS
jgi:hypothetical protein